MQLSSAARASLPALSLTTCFNGVFGSLSGQIPYGMLTFGSYEVIKKKLINAFPAQRPEMLYFISAILGDLTGSLWLCPTEIVKQRVQSGMFTNSIVAAKSILADKGLMGLYTGYLSQITRDVPFRAIQLTSYEMVKKKWVDAYCQEAVLDDQGRAQLDKSGNPVIMMRPLHNHESMIIGSIAGTISAALTNPLDVLKTRTMTGTITAPTTVPQLLRPLASLAQIVEKEGLGAMLGGIGPRCVYVGPSCGLFFVVYEGTRNAITAWENRQHGGV